MAVVGPHKGFNFKEGKVFSISTKRRFSDGQWKGTPPAAGRNAVKSIAYDLAFRLDGRHAICGCSRILCVGI